MALAHHPITSPRSFGVLGGPARPRKDVAGAEEGETLRILMRPRSPSPVPLPQRGHLIHVAQRPQRWQLNQTSLHSQFPRFLRIAAFSHCFLNPVLLKITLLCLTKKMHLEYRILKRECAQMAAIFKEIPFSSLGICNPL